MSRGPVPYRRIADALRGQIESGELVPGARVPSTRALARTWKVANATAAHALQSLVHDGLLIARPRSSTVVAGKRADRRTELSRGRVIAAALAMADDEGLPALSIRGLAARLAVPVMSLYRHVRSKEQLIALMADAALGEATLHEPPPSGWRDQLEQAARAEWQIFRKHPWLAHVVHISRPAPMPNAIAYVNWVMRALDASSLDGAGKLRVHVMLHGFTQGMAVNLEAEAQAVAETGVSGDDYMRAQAARFDALVTTGRYPSFAKLMRDLPDDFTLDIDELFERGLAAMLDGLKPLIERRA
jgi:DNA-binding transcriptional regulator YhcF (GntR family)